MTEELRDALEAVSSGQREKARVILAEFLRHDPQNVPAWVLLSKLATTEGQKTAFLRKILDLDPGHAYARQVLAEMGGVQPPVVTVDEPSATETPSEDVSVQAPDAGELPAETISEAGTASEEAPVEDLFDEATPDAFDFEEEVPFDVGDEAEETDEAETDWLTSEAFYDEGAEEDEPDWLASEEFDALDLDEAGSDWSAFEDVEARAEEDFEEAGPDWPDLDDIEDIDDDVALTGGEAMPALEDPDATEDTLFETPQVQPTAQEAADDEILPAWLSGDDDDWLADEEVDAEHAIETTEADDAIASEKAARLAAAMSESAPPQSEIDADTGSGRGWLLALLIVVAAIVFLLLVYAVLTLMP